MLTSVSTPKATFGEGRTHSTPTEHDELGTAVTGGPDRSASELLGLVPRDAVAVVGGGVVGLCSAWEIARRGRPVVVLDREEIGAGCGIGSTGHIVPSHVVPLAAQGMVRAVLDTVLKRHGQVSLRLAASLSYWRWVAEFLTSCTRHNVASAAPALSDLFELSMAPIAELESLAGLDVSRDGLLDLYADSGAFERACRHAEELGDYGVRYAIADRAQVLALEPAVTDSVVGAVHYLDDASVHPARFLEALTDAAEGHGVVGVPGVEVLDVHGHGGRVTTLRTSHGDLAASHVVVAAGSWSARVGAMLGERIPVLAGRGFSVTFDRPRTGPSRALLLGEAHVSVGVHGDEMRLGSGFQLGATDRSASQLRLDRLAQAARTRLRIDGDLRVRRPWAGLRPVAPDGVPIIGPSSRWQNVTVATGHAMIGLSTGPGTGRLVAQLVAGEATDIDIGRFSLARFQ